MEILNEEKQGGANNGGATPTPPQTNNNGCGQILITILKVIGWAIGIGWLLTAFGLLLSFIMLVAIGKFESTYITDIEGFSPVVFAGLICAVIVLGMGIMADLWFKLLRSKRVNLRNLLISGVVWLIFFSWLCVVGVRNGHNWHLWADQVEYRLEHWEEEIDEWAEDIEDWAEELEEEMENLTVGAVSSTHSINFELKGFPGIMKLERLCEKFDELYRVDEEIERFLLRGEDVDINITISQQDNTISRSTAITTPKGRKVLNINLDSTTGTCLKYEVSE